eukprot:COSAG01_NODE_6850_length_3469_cov_240.717211_1_plen_89_part_00
MLRAAHASVTCTVYAIAQGAKQTAAYTARETQTEKLNRIACGLEEMPLPLGHKILFGPVEKPVLRGNPRGMEAVEHPVIATLTKHLRI